LVATFAAQVAAEHKANLVLQHVIQPQERHEALAGRSIDDLEAELASLVPAELQSAIKMQSIVVPGDATQELLYQCKAQQADLIVLGAQGASAFAAAARQGVVYKVAAHSLCPVLTLSPVVLAADGVKADKAIEPEASLGGVF
jgi:nucleotide-binding universal stress UspA family protein